MVGRLLRYVCIFVVAAFVGEVAAKSVFPMPRLDAVCTRTVVRRDIVTLAPAELERFIRTVKEMHRRGWMDGFGSMHNHISHQIHGNEHFFAWHRRFLRHFEMLMQEIDPEAILPYWNWGTHWQNPLTDPVLSSAYFGGNGRPSDNCVVDGAEERWGRNYPKRNCLTRKYRYGTSTGAFWPMRAVRDVMNTAVTHAQFRSRIENGPHGIVHLGLGGDFETMWAPVDVLFFMHHAMLDKVWAEWQSRDQIRFHSVDGYDASRQPVMAKSLMPFYGEEVGTALLTNGPGYCYIYDDLPAPVAVKPRRAARVAFNAGLNTTSAEYYHPSALPLMPAVAAGHIIPTVPARFVKPAGKALFAKEESPESALIEDFAPPPPLNESWMAKMNVDVEEAERMNRFVNNVVAQINAERRQGSNADAQDQN
ncbi:hypothetical protein BX661DRAFT_8771 [Kickxella alabastrina]|uniref:uncharacterized protein n=1 Tax=Kickxella alabastrina TaxID=61397 RepID=UPI00221EB6C7|nr:uncharacterized protein BX661DRAFT_8771 [Kickxella alabastrina]KAI7834940.1 hypothetical protein BX661DRAFT_8771 [Kickxella alabastrina]KAJ1947896.1 hypothetical protein GGF37_000043 [Kickxella alabastrina]